LIFVSLRCRSPFFPRSVCGQLVLLSVYPLSINGHRFFFFGQAFSPPLLASPCFSFVPTTLFYFGVHNKIFCAFLIARRPFLRIRPFRPTRRNAAVPYFGFSSLKRISLPGCYSFSLFFFTYHTNSSESTGGGRIPFLGRLAFFPTFHTLLIGPEVPSLAGSSSCFLILPFEKGHGFQTCYLYATPFSSPLTLLVVYEVEITPADLQPHM